jgi:hypothetical protein
VILLVALALAGLAVLLLVALTDPGDDRDQDG